MPVGGSIAAVSIGGQNFAVASDCDVGLNLGAIKPTTRRNGDGTTRVTGERQDWSLTDIDLSIDASADQLSFLASIANALELTNCTITLIDETVYQGNGIPIGDFSFSTGKSVLRLSLMGEGQLTKQASGLGGLLGAIAKLF